MSHTRFGWRLSVGWIAMLVALPLLVHAQVQEQDSLALVALYNATNGAEWTNNTNWLTGPVATWHGVSISGNRVTKIILRTNRLSGEIPPVVGNLSELNHLDLGGDEFIGGNQLNGAIPPEIGNLSNLQILRLNRNQLSGTIPIELGNLSNLRSLDLRSNNLSGTIPLVLSNLSQLQYFDLSYNELTGAIPSELSNPSALQYVNLSNNELSGTIPQELGNLSELQTLSLGGNQLSGEIPSELGNLGGLTSLGLAHNQLTGSIPSELCNLYNLRGLSLSRNQLSGGIPSGLGNFSDLWYLNLSDNQLSGELPSGLGNLSKLQYLSLGGNQLSGEIPQGIGNLVELMELSLARNQLSGEFPQGIGNLTKLRTIYLGENQLSGEIPPELGNLSEMWYLDLSNNQLSGEIPPEFGNLSSLSILYLSQNQLSGEIPPELGDLSHMEDLYLDQNQLSGSIPLSFIALRLYAFHFDETELCEPDEEAFHSWLEGVYMPVESTGVICTTSHLESLISLSGGPTGTFNLDVAGVQFTVTHPDRASGLLIANRIERPAPYNDQIHTRTVSAPAGPVTPNVVSPNRHWFITAPGVPNSLSHQSPGLTDFSYNICLDITGLPDIDNPSGLVIVHRLQLGEPWEPLNSTLKTDGDFTYLCADNLRVLNSSAFHINTATMFFGIGAEAADNPLPVEDNLHATVWGIDPVYPNPFQATATIHFSTDRQEPVRLELYNVTGQHVRTLYEGIPGVGVEQVIKLDGSGLASGLYMVRLVSGDRIETQPILRVR